MFAILVGNRHLGSNPRSVAMCDTIVSSILTDLMTKHGVGLNVLSISCDTAFGKSVRVFCEENGIKFAEFVVYFNGPRERDEYDRTYKARHAALLDAGDVFHIVNNPKQVTTIRDLLERVKEANKPYYLYNEKGTVIEFKN